MLACHCIGRASPPLRTTPPNFSPRALPPCSWNAFYHSIDEDLVKEQADLMVSLGLRDAG